MKLLGDTAVADEIVHSIVAAVGAFARNPDLLYTARQEMARRIEQLTRRWYTSVTAFFRYKLGADDHASTW